MEEDPEVKRRRLILEEARDIDADSDGSESESSEEEYVMLTLYSVNPTKVWTETMMTTRTRPRNLCANLRR